MDYVFPQGGTDATIYAWLYQDNGGSNPGEPQTGLTSASTGIGLSYVRPLGTVQTVTLSDLATVDASHSDGGMIEVDSAAMPGLYRFDLPDAAIARGENFVKVVITADAIVPQVVHITLDPEPSRVQGSVNDASATTTSFVTDLSETQDDQFNDAFLLFTSGANAGALREITDYNGTSKAVTCDAFPVAPADTDQFVIVNY